MKIKTLIDEDFSNYKKPALFIAFPSCTFKCEKECGIKCCQNSELVNRKTIEIDDNNIINRYLKNKITQAVVIGGLEPMDDFQDLHSFIYRFREVSNDDIVIYTGYYPNEINEKINKLKEFPNIIIKFGRYIPDEQKIFDNILGVYLASKNQFAIRIS